MRDGSGLPAERIASEGGQPIFPAGPPLWPRPSEAVRAALVAAYADGSWGRYHGPYCERLRERLATMHGLAHAWLCSSGTIGVELALRGLKIGPGDEVILAAYDFPGNFRAIEAVGARPVLVDLAPGSWTIDPDGVAAAVSSQSRAVIVSHLHGSLADMPRLRALADRAGMAIVEDVCQAPGAVVTGRIAGAWGDAAVLSFGGSKLLTAGRGGAVLTSRADVLQRIKIYCERGNDAFPLSELQAAVLLPQLDFLAHHHAARREAVRTLLAACDGLPGLLPLPLPRDEQSSPVFYKLPWLLSGNSDACGTPEFEQRRRGFIEAVRAEGVALEAGFRGFARRGGQRCAAVGKLPRARQAATGTVILHHPVLLEPGTTLREVARALRRVAERMFKD